MPAKDDRPLVAALWMIGAVFAFSGMAVATRYVKLRHDVFELQAYRSILGVAIVLAICAASGRLRLIRAHQVPMHVLRNALHFTGQSLWVWAVVHIPLAQVFALEFTSPLWLILLSPLLLGERMTAPKTLATLIGFGGILLVVNPDFAQPEPGVIAAALSAIFFALTMVLTKRLTQEEHVLSILFWLTLTQAVFGCALALGDGAITLPNGQSLPWLIFIGLAGVGAHLCVTKALSLAAASFVAPIDFLRLPMIAVVGAILYDEPLTLGLAFGAALIIAANLLSLRLQAQEKASAGVENLSPEASRKL